MQRTSLLLPALLLAACGSGKPRTIENTTFAPALGVNLAVSTRTPHGEYIRDLANGSGPALAPGQTVFAHYTGFFPDGSIFDSNQGSIPISFVLGAGQVIPGWDEGLVGARVGGTRQLVVPPALAYGARGYAQIPPNAILVFSVQLETAPTIENTTFASALGVDLAASTKTLHGEYYRDLAAGTGAPLAAGQTVSAHYTGYFSDGTVFDSNQGRAAFSFVLGAGQVISGWDEGLVGTRVGGTRQLVIPPELGYGASGSGQIPPNAILVFSVKVDAAQ